MTSPDDDRCVEARQFYVEGRMTIAGIAVRCGVADSTVRRWAEKYDWPPRRALHRKSGRRKAKAATEVPVDRGEADPAVVRGAGDAVAPSASTVTLPAPPTPADASPEQIDVNSLTLRIYRAMHRNLDIMESRMNDDNAEPDRNIRTLGDAARSADKLKDLQAGNLPAPGKLPLSTASPNSGRAPRNADEADAYRRELVERIRKIEQRRGSRGDDRT